jgi:hypothetical protein
MSVERELIREPANWRHDPHKVADLGRWLENRCYFRTPEERWTFIDKLERAGNDELYKEMLDEERQEEQRRMYEDEAFAELERGYQ